MKKYLLTACAALILVIAVPPPAGSTPSLPMERMAAKKISIHGKNFALATLLVALGREAGVNVFVSGKIKGRANLDLDDVNLDQVFLLLLDEKNLRYRVKNGIIMVETEKDFHQAKRDMANIRLCTRYSKIADHTDEIKAILSPVGRVVKSNRGNCLVIHDRGENLKLARDMLAEIDLPVSQVHIKARIVTVTREAKKRLGIRWNYNNLQTANPISSVIDLSVDHNSNFNIGFLRNSLDLSVDIQALEQENKLNILSSPEIMVLDGRTAEIKQGKEVPYTTQTTDNIQNTSFREANLSLKVTPRVMAGDRIQLDIAVTNDSVDQNNQVGSEPLINKQAITTDLILADGVTVVIGGILLESRDHQKGGVPILSKLPLLGHFFRNTEKVNERSELLVFLTPRIVDFETNDKAGTDMDEPTDGHETS